MKIKLWFTLYYYFSPKIYIIHRRLFKLRRLYHKIKGLYRILGIRSKYRIIKSKFNKTNILIQNETKSFTSNTSANILNYKQSKINNKSVALCIGSLGHGGAERQWVLLSIGFKLIGFSPTLIIQHNLNEASPYLLNLLHKYQIKVVSIADLRDFRYYHLNFQDMNFNYQFMTTQAYDEFKKLQNESENILNCSIKYFEDNYFNYVFIALDYANIIFGVSALINNFPNISISFRSLSPAFYKNDYGMYNLYKEILNHNNIFLTSNSLHGSKSYTDYFNLNKEIKVINNCDFFETITNESGCICEKFHIFGFMRLSPEKNPMLWLQACEDIFKKLGNNFHFVLSGEGILRDQVLEKIIQLKNSGLDIDLIYSLQPSEYFKNSKGILLISSNTEGQSNLLSEAKHYEYPFFILNKIDEIIFDNNINLDYPGVIEKLAKKIYSEQKIAKLRGDKNYDTSVEILKDYANEYLTLNNIS